MKYSWLHQKGRENLIIFCNGWGMDGHPFEPLASSRYDVLTLFNYDDFESDLDFSTLLSQYREVFLVSWSMGVWAGQQLFEKRAKRLQRCLAINGTLCPVHDQYGIPMDVFSATLTGWNEATRLKFYRRMCKDRELLDRFVSHQPQRECIEQQRELAALTLVLGCRPATEAIYDEILVGEHDFIIPTAHQRAYWQEKKVQLLDGSHFLFYGFECWDQLIESSPDQLKRLFSSPP